jgi:hypothetical protein
MVGMELPHRPRFVADGCHGPAWAQDCTPHKLLATVQMKDAEPESNIRTVPVP